MEQQRDMLRFDMQPVGHASQGVAADAVVGSAAEPVVDEVAGIVAADTVAAVEGKDQTLGLVCLGR